MKLGLRGLVVRPSSVCPISSLLLQGIPTYDPYPPTPSLLALHAQRSHPATFTINAPSLSATFHLLAILLLHMLYISSPNGSSHCTMHLTHEWYSSSSRISDMSEAPPRVESQAWATPCLKHFPFIFSGELLKLLEYDCWLWFCLLIWSTNIYKIFFVIYIHLLVLLYPLEATFWTTINSYINWSKRWNR